MRRAVKCINETISQLVDGVRTVQEDQSKMTLIIDKLATKVLYCVSFHTASLGLRFFFSYLTFFFLRSIT